MIGISGNGRTNIQGPSYLYAASNEQTACMEVKSQFGDLISLATFELSKDIEIIDFSSDKVFEREETELHNMSMGVFFSHLIFQYCVPVESENKNVYRATQIISDYLRKTGIDGIAYKSFLAPEGVNYTFFNCHPTIFRYVY